MAKKDGVIVGCAQNHEWMLPWWWLNYRLHNVYPVTFFDFGDMSETAKEWCKKRGTLKKVRMPHKIAPKEKVHEKLHSVWEPLVSGLDVWEARSHFFKKPFACLQSPYERTVWIDLDAQVRLPIDHIFDFCEGEGGFSVVEEPEDVRAQHEACNLLLKGEVEYNTGVIAFKNKCPLLKEWADACVAMNHIVRGDQEALSRMLFEKNERINPLLPIFNWRATIAPKLNQAQSLVIIHWLGACKAGIKQQMAVLSTCAIDLSL